MQIKFLSLLYNSIVKNIFKIIIFLIILGVLYQYQNTIRPYITPFFKEVITKLGIINRPCEKPITYILGTFDTQFGISKKYFLSALSDAEIIWEKPFGKELFNFQEDGILKVNLIYDYRQDATSKLASLGIAVKDTRASYDTLKIKFTELKIKFTTAENDYNERAQNFDIKKKTYEQQVEYWNMQGGAPRKEYDQLQLEKSLLDTQSSQLQILQKQINEIVSEINALVVVLNRLANILNISVEKYNTIGASRGESFEEGVYQKNGINEEIDVYEFSNREKLVRVLAHELGHALGLPHVDDPKAIMYKLNQGHNQILTDADLVALKIKCQTK